MPVRIFCCYAREDEALLNKLKSHLSPLQHEGFIDVWYDRNISAGAVWEEEINEQLNDAQIILLLISPDFMASDYCYGIEMKRALERHKGNEACVIPIILRPVYWKVAALRNLQVLPTDARPVIDHHSWYDIDEALFSVAEGIREVVNKLSVNPLVEVPKLLPVEIPMPFSDEPIRARAQKSPSLEDVEASDRVVVVAARYGLMDYLKYSAYICQPNRSFRDCVRLAFYTNHKIDRRVPRILGQVEAISQVGVETRTDLSDLDRERLRKIIRSLDQAKRDVWSGEFKVIFLSSPESSETLVLPQDIFNNLTSDSGRGIAFTQGQRYISLASLEKGPKSTSELIVSQSES